MQITQSNLGDAKVLALSGRLDAEAASELEARCERLVQSGARTMILNLTSLDYLSSAGLRAILSGGKTLQAGDGKLVLVIPEGTARQIVEAAGFDKVFTVCRTMQEAGKYTVGNFQIHLRKDWDVDIMTVYGRVDAERAPELEAAGRQVLDASHLKLIISLGSVDYLSSAGLSALLNLAKFAETRHCRLFLCSPSASVKQILELSGFDKILPIRETVDAALVE
jgi:anti-anti-sigma factor